MQHSEIFQKFLDNQVSPEEIDDLKKLFDSADENELRELVGNALQQHEGSPVENEEVRLRAIFDNVLREKGRKKYKLNTTYLIRIAAALGFMLIGVYLFSYYYKSDKDDNNKKITLNDIVPGKNGATLTLANGKKIPLNDAANGEIAKQAGITVSKTADGQLLYQGDGNSAGIHAHNTLTTAKGETYTLTLPDGSKVWMNAASSLTYPAALVEGRLRRVKLAGEAYFEVTKDKTHPFIVETDKQLITVLGTHFNVNSYNDENETKTTLLEGSVKVALLADTLKSAVLKPNQESVIVSGGISVRDADPELAIAWKSGFFMFDDENLESVMKKITRWYDVQVIYKDPSIRSIPFLGTMSRYDNISKVLQILERTHVATFELEGRIITVKKKK